jgi:hypothetical protein
LCLCLPVNAATVELDTYITHILRSAPGFELKDGPPRPGFVLAEQKNLPRMKLGLNRGANSAKCATITTNYHRAIVVEDAVSGVQAGFKGNFGLVIGVVRENNVHE